MVGERERRGEGEKGRKCFHSLVRKIPRDPNCNDSVPAEAGKWTAMMELVGRELPNPQGAHISPGNAKL